MARAAVIGDLRCEGIKTVGNFDLTAARIGGQVSLLRAHLRAADSDPSAVAFTADRAEIGGDLFSARRATPPYEAHGFSCVGTMSLVRAHVSGHLILHQAKDGLGSDNTLSAPGLCVGRDLAVFTAGAIDLSSAEITGDLKIDLAHLQPNPDSPPPQPEDPDHLGADEPDRSPAADLSGVRANVLTLPNRPIKGIVDLTRASVHLLLDNPSHWPAGSHIVLDRFEYDDIAAIDTNDNQRSARLAWVEMGSQLVRRAEGTYDEPKFIPQPYRQLATFYQHAGQDGDAHQILLAMCRKHNSIVIPRRRVHVKLWNYAQDLFLGYGYVPWRAVLSLLVLATGTTIWFSYFDQHRIGLIRAAILSAGLSLPGSGYDKLEKFNQPGDPSYVIAAALILVGLVLGATVIAAIARVIKQL